MDSDIKESRGILAFSLEKRSTDVEAGQHERGYYAGGNTPKQDVQGNHNSALRRVLGYCVVLVAMMLLTHRAVLEFDISKLWNSHEFQGVGNIEYAAVPGFFKQSIWGANATEIGPVRFFARIRVNESNSRCVQSPKRFGLIDGHSKYWATFRQKIKKMNKRSDENTTYKVLFLGRHGEGYHNLGLNYYGEKEWDRKWGRLNGNGTITWGPDAKLTPHGIDQAMRVNAVWKEEMQNGGGIPLPTALFVSPLRRALFTLNISFAGVVHCTPPLIIENLRDAYGLRTSDWRHNKPWIHERVPGFEFEEGFTESDELWEKDKREPTEHVQERVKGVLDRIFALSDTYLALVAHDKVISATFNLTGHPDYELPTGG
ncbi:hypothetical protein FRC01_006838 [Tulasnella sp. 417]|nr:hypothetical protein FRC01_006838 [Tulasnella sp. 417]